MVDLSEFATPTRSTMLQKFLDALPPEQREKADAAIDAVGTISADNIYRVFQGWWEQNPELPKPPGASSIQKHRRD